MREMFNFFFVLFFAMGSQGALGCPTPLNRMIQKDSSFLSTVGIYFDDLGNYNKSIDTYKLQEISLGFSKVLNSIDFQNMTEVIQKSDLNKFNSFRTNFKFNVFIINSENPAAQSSIDGQIIITTKAVQKIIDASISTSKLSRLNFFKHYRTASEGKCKNNTNAQSDIDLFTDFSLINNMARNAFYFLIYHEAGHVILNHHSSKNLNCSVRKTLELDADAVAMTNIIMILRHEVKTRGYIFGISSPKKIVEIYISIFSSDNSIVPFASANSESCKPLSSKERMRRTSEDWISFFNEYYKFIENAFVECLKTQYANQCRSIKSRT